jgi:molybdate transport system substrate-binding protein
MRSIPAALGLAFAVMTLTFPAAASAQLHVITSGGFRAAYQAALPEFERTATVSVTSGSGASQGDGPNTIGAQLRRGVQADVVIMAREGLDELVNEGRVIAATVTDLAQTPVGVAIRAGSPRPDLSTVDSFTRALLAARSVGYVNSTVGIYLRTKLFPRLGVADRIVPKLNGEGIAAVVRGEADFTIQPLSEVTNVKGAEVVGIIPESIQYISVFSAAVVSGAAQPDLGRRLIAYLASQNADAAMTASGMEPSRKK